MSLGNQKFDSEFFPGVNGGMRNSLFFWGCYWLEQKFLIYACVIERIRNSEFFPVFLGGSANSELFPVFLGDQKF